MFSEIDAQHDLALKRDEEHTALVNENIRMKREALEREETGKIQQMKLENDKMKELFSNNTTDLNSVRTSHVQEH